MLLIESFDKYLISDKLVVAAIECNSKEPYTDCGWVNVKHIISLVNNIVSVKPQVVVLHVWRGEGIALPKLEKMVNKLLNADLAVRMSSQQIKSGYYAPPDTNNLISNNLVVAMIEYTSNCNLRCSYCRVSKKGWVGKDLPEQLSIRVNEQIIKASPKTVIMHGHGETTMLPYWVQSARILDQAAIKLSICSNLAKEYSEDELNMLARFKHLAISIDTINVPLFKKLRKGADIRTVLYNMSRIMAIASRINNQIFITWSIVCCDLTIFGLEELVELGISMGVNGFTFCNLTVYDMSKNDIDIIHVSEMSLEMCVSAIKIFENIRIMCDNNDCVCQISSGLIDTIEDKVSRGSLL